MDSIYLTEIMPTYWLQILDEYQEEVDTPYSGGFDLCLQLLFRYYNELPLGEAIESDFISCGSQNNTD